MAQQILACIYGQDGNDWNLSTGTYLGFPTQGIVIIPLRAGETMSGVSMKSKIKIISNDPFLTAPEFFTDRTVDSLITASNL